MKIQKVLVQKVKTYKYLPEIIVESEELDNIEVDEILNEENGNNDYIFIRTNFKNIEIYNEFGGLTSEKFKLTIGNKIIECLIDTCSLDSIREKYRVRFKVLAVEKVV